MSALGFVFNWWTAPWSLQDLQFYWNKTELFLLFPKRAWETCYMMSYESRDRHVSSAHVPRAQQGWVLLAWTYSSSQKIISSDVFWINQISSLKTQLTPSQTHWGSWCHHWRTQGARKPATFCFPICLLLLQDLHTPSTNTWTVRAALVSAFATAHPEAAGLSRVWSVPREAGQRRHRNTSSNSEEPSHSFTAPQSFGSTKRLLLFRIYYLKQIRIILVKFSKPSTKLPAF